MDNNKYIDSVYAVRDNLVGVYLPPFLGDSDARMIRQFGDAVEKGDTELSKHPSDFTLEFLGAFNRETGEFLLPDTGKRVLARASDFAKETK